MAKYSKLTYILLAFAFCNLTTACENPLYEDENEYQETETPKGDMVRITFGNFKTNQKSFSQAQGNSPEYEAQQSRTSEATPISELCTRINFALFDYKTGERIKTLNQTTDDDSFGKITLNLSKGKYAVLVIAHSGDGNATLSNPEKVTFKDNKITDTFYYYNVIDVEEDSNYDMTLKRAVAKFRLVVEDHTPSDVKVMKFYYTGGSSTFNAITGYGCVNSKQTELRDVTESAYNEGSYYDIYTFPHNSEEDKKLKVEISAMSSASSYTILFSKTISDVAISKNKYICYKGHFFNVVPENDQEFTLSTTDVWQYEEFKY